MNAALLILLIVVALAPGVAFWFWVRDRTAPLFVAGLFFLTWAGTATGLEMWGASTEEAVMLTLAGILVYGIVSLIIATILDQFIGW